MRSFALFAALLVGSWSFAAAPFKPPVAGKKPAVVKPKQGVLINNVRPAGENNQKDDGQQGQNDDGQKNQQDDGQQNNKNDGQQGQNGNGNINVLKGIKKQ